MEKYLRVGVITSPHGVRGEVKVYPTTDDAMRFKKLDHVILDLGRGESRELKIRQVKFFKNMVILKFDGVDTMNEVEGWRQKDLLITRDQAVPLQEDEFFITYCCHGRRGYARNADGCDGDRSKRCLLCKDTGGKGTSSPGDPRLHSRCGS